MKFCAQAIFNYKRQPPGFQNFKFINFSVYTTLSVPKQPISIKNFVHCGALQSRRAISGLFSSFYTPVYCINSTGMLIRELNHANSDMLHYLLTLQGEPFLKQAVGMVQAVGCNARYNIIRYRL